MIVPYSDHVEDLHVTARESLHDVMGRTEALQYNGTDMALPILQALENNIPADCFIIATDGGVWAGPFHAKEALAVPPKDWHNGQGGVAGVRGELVFHH